MLYTLKKNERTISNDKLFLKKPKNEENDNIEMKGKDQNFIIEKRKIRNVKNTMDQYFNFEKKRKKKKILLIFRK